MEDYASASVVAGSLTSKLANGKKSYGKVQSPVAEQWTCSYVETLWSTSFWNGKVPSPVAAAMDL